MPHVLMIIAPEVFRDEEYSHPVEVLTGRGVRVTTASTRPGPCHGKLGLTVTADIALADARAADYDAVVFVGGGGAQVFFDDPAAHSLARDAYALGRVVAAICIAPSVLARAGLLAGVPATAFASQRDDLVEHGALWTGTPVETHGRIVTANGPEAAHDFGTAIADLLGA